MNLRDFLNYRTNCPLCDSTMITYFHSRRQQSIKYEDGRLSVSFLLNAVGKKQTNYKGAYSFGMDDNSFRIEFYTKDDVHYYDRSPDFLISRFKELHKNLKDFRFFRDCKHCFAYRYVSSFFDFDYETSTIEHLRVSQENVILTHKMNDESYRIFRLNNSLLINESELTFWKSTTKAHNLQSFETSGTVFCLPLIPFVSKEKTIARLNDLIVYT